MTRAPTKAYNVHRVLAALPEDDVPHIILDLTTVTLDSALCDLDAGQSAGHSTNFSSVMCDTEPVPTDDSYAGDVCELSGVVGDSQLSMEEAMRSAAASFTETEEHTTNSSPQVEHKYGILHGAFALSEYPLHFIMGAFPTLFPLGIGGPDSLHRKGNFSFDMWSKYLMHHSSRKFVQHYSFMFVLFGIHIESVFVICCCC